MTWTLGRKHTYTLWHEHYAESTCKHYDMNTRQKAHTYIMTRTLSWKHKIHYDMNTILKAHTNIMTWTLGWKHTQTLWHEHYDESTRKHCDMNTWLKAHTYLMTWTLGWKHTILYDMNTMLKAHTNIMTRTLGWKHTYTLWHEHFAESTHIPIDMNTWLNTRTYLMTWILGWKHTQTLWHEHLAESTQETWHKYFTANTCTMWHEHLLKAHAQCNMNTLLKTHIKGQRSYLVIKKNNKKKKKEMTVCWKHTEKACISMTFIDSNTLLKVQKKEGNNIITSYCLCIYKSSTPT